MEDITILVVDDHPLFRQGVVDTLSLEPEFRVIAQAINGEEALASIRSLMPDIAIVDINLPVLNGQQVAQVAASEKLPTRIILMTGYDDDEQMKQAIRVGAAAYCVKDLDPAKLATVVRQVAEGNYVIGETVYTGEELKQWQEPTTQIEDRFPMDGSEPFEPLSPREMEVLGLVTRGMSNKEIATELGISHQTVKNHVTSILHKLNVEDRTQAALYALRRGWFRIQINEEGPK